MGSKAPTTTSTNTVPPQVLAQYQKVLDRANPVADTPYQPYGGQLTAPLNDLQNQAYWGLGITQHISEPYAQQGLGQATSGFNTTAGALPYYQQGAAGVAGAQPYYKAASDYANASTSPLNMQAYLSPYVQNVVDTTMANAQRSNAIARQGVVGNAISSGAWGGDRAGVAQAELARNQAMTDNATIAGLENANYSQALTAAQADQARKAQAASLMGGLGNSQIQAGLGYGQLASGVGTLGGTMTGQGVATAGLGTAAQNNAINAYNAQMAGGTQAQQTAQADLDAQYAQWQNAIAFPYQQLGWLSNISTSIGSGSGGTTTSTGSAPSAASQILGGATALAGLFKLRRGGVVPGYAGGGVASGFSFPRAGMYGTDMVSTPGSTGLVPAIRINAARLSAPAAIDPNKGQADPMKMGQQAAGAISGLSGLFNGPSYGGASSAMGDPTGLGGLYRRGGQVRGFAGGGALDFDDRFAPALDAEASGLFQPYSVDSNSPIIPDPGLQQVSPEAMQAWRNEADTPNPAVAADQGLAQSQPAPLPPQITGDPQPLPDNALAFDGAGLAPRSVPTQILPPVAQQSQGLSQSVDAGSRPAGGLLGKMGMTEDQRMAMLQLGLGLLASRSPNFGTALGEAGLGAAAAMNQTQQTRAAQAIKDREYGLDVQRLQQQAHDAAERIRLTGESQIETQRHNKATEAARDDKLPEQIQQYNFAKAQGYQGNFMDFRKELSAAGKTEVNINQVGEKEYEKQNAKEFAEMNRKLIDGAQSARMKLGTLTRMGQLLSDPKIYTGAGANQILSAKKLAKAVGIDVGDVSGPETIKTIGNQFALELRNPAGGAGMPGALSDKDREFLQASVPGLGQTPAGNAKIVEYMKRVAQRSLDVERLRQDYVKRNGRLDEGFYRELEAFSDSHPLFPEAASAPSVSRKIPVQNSPSPKVGDTKMFKQGLGVWDGKQWKPKT